MWMVADGLAIAITGADAITGLLLAFGNGAKQTRIIPKLLLSGSSYDFW